MPAARTVDVQTFLNEHPFSGFQWVIFALCFCVVLLDGFDTAAIGYIAPSLITEWGVERPALAPVLSAALFGLAFGALSSGPLADRLGRKVVLVGSVLIMGVACLASAFAGSLDHLVVWRFITGLGLGAAMPNAVTLMSEYCPDGRRAMLTNAMFCGFPLGAAFGGFLAAWMIPQWGWRSVLVLGGTTPLVLTLLLLLLLPESVRYMVAKNHRWNGFAPCCAASRRYGARGHVHSSCPRKRRRPRPRAASEWYCPAHTVVGSVMLWVAYFMGLVIFYALINWMPLLFKDAGLSAADRRADLGPIPARRRRGHPVRLADGPLQRQRDHRGRLRADRGGGLRDRPGRPATSAAGGGRVRGRHADEHVPVVAAGAGGRFYPTRRAAPPAWPGCWELAASAASPAPSSWPSSPAGNSASPRSSRSWPSPD